VARRILEDEPVWLFDPDHRLARTLPDEVKVIRLEERANASDCDQENAGIWVSEYLAPADCRCLLLRPRNLVVGVGCNRGTSAEEILDLVRATFARERLCPLSIRNLASVDLKSDEQGMLEAAKELGRPIRFHTRREIDQVAVPNPSRMVLGHVGVESVCEATALLSAQSSQLLITKQKTANVTLAVARVVFPS
jgi:cobalt-precorrin 5A hydrolase